MTDINLFYNSISQITSDRSQSIDDRIVAVFEYKQSLGCEDPVEIGRLDAICMSMLAAMIDREVKDHTYDVELMQISTLAAEAAVRGQIESSLNDVARQVLHLLDNSGLPYELLEVAMPRIIEAMKSSVYNRNRCLLMMAFLHRAALEDYNGRKYDREIIEEVMRSWLNLYLLLDKENRPQMDITVYEFVNKILGSEEIEKIEKNPREGMLRKDPVEYTKRWEEVYYDAKAELDSIFADTPKRMGFCFEYWHAQAELLRRKYGIEWHNPHLMNPRVMFD